MAEKTNIEWCDATINFWWGCTKVSPGCANCYAEALDARFHGHHYTGRPIHWGANKRRKKIKGAVKQAIKLNRKARDGRFGEWAKTGDMAPVRPRVFCSSMADWLDPEVPVEWLAEMLDTIRVTPHLDWLLLTKRPENFRDRIESAFCSISPAFDQDTPLSERELWEETSSGKLHRWLVEWKHNVSVPPNVWIGTSVEDQKRSDERIPSLLNIPAKVRFLSCEPLLGPVDFNLRQGNEDGDEWYANALRAGIDWVICGGESGPKARPMHPDWARSLRDQCEAAGVPFFYKQWGEYVSVSEVEGEGEHYKFKDGATVRKIGKKAAGRTLDGRLHNEFPKEAIVI